MLCWGVQFRLAFARRLTCAEFERRRFRLPFSGARGRELRQR
jgi:hypothetical protein